MFVEYSLQARDLGADWISRFSFDIILGTNLDDDYPFMFTVIILSCHFPPCIPIRNKTQL